MDEFEFIDKFLRPLASNPNAHGLTDDGASLPNAPEGKEWRITTDTLVEGVHFRVSDSVIDVAWRSLAVNVSDLVAQLAAPKFYLINISLNPRFSRADFAEGLKLAQKHFGLSLLGGDTTSTRGPVTISITMIGLGVFGQNPLRENAKVGESVYLLAPSPLGASKAGFEGLPEFIDDFSRPKTCFSYLPDLQRQEISAAVDISDGILQDLGRICEASQVGSAIYLDSLPLALTNHDPLAQITWGEDFGLVITSKKRPMLADVIKIGEVIKGSCVKLINSNGQEIEVIFPGYVHDRHL